jgi:hypothetical protein
MNKRSGKELDSKKKLDNDIILTGDMNLFFRAMQILLPVKNDVCITRKNIISSTIFETILFKNLFEIKEDMKISNKTMRYLFLSIKNMRSHTVRLKNKPFNEKFEYVSPKISIYPTFYCLEAMNEVYSKFKFEYTNINLNAFGFSNFLHGFTKTFEIHNFGEYPIKYRADRTERIKERKYPIYVTTIENSLVLESPYVENATKAFLRKYPRFENQVRLQIKSCADFGPTKMVERFWLTGMELSRYLFPNRQVIFLQSDGEYALYSPDRFLYKISKRLLPAELNKIYSSKVRKMIDFSKYK